eukprot:TRINITY_DN11764_c0_g1_i1.p1 TRINITY_DN11764_c0_g1~~TRINITY_DN11764_c0_g1_i1.p1  ORF type:complete len:307 (-),score=44.53 TRINITY_DN11764_c0_g1_i1:440-1360(-)
MSRPCYHLLQEIDGHGAQATVFEAVAVSSGDDGGEDMFSGGEQYVAVKVFDKKNAQAAMMSELRMLTAVQGHPNIVRLVDGLVDGWTANDETHYIVLELCGEDLRKSVKRAPFTQDRAVEIIRGVLSALVHVHEHGIVHRDVKPANIAIAPDGGPRLMDFGVAAFLTDEAEARRFCGTVGFAAPEIHRGTAYGLPVDVYGVGATLYFVLSGRLAFATPGMTKDELIAQIVQCAVSFDRDFDHVSEHLKETIKWLMHTEASRRPLAIRALRWPPFASEFAHVGRQDEHCGFAEVPDELTLDAHPETF